MKMDTAKGNSGISPRVLLQVVFVVIVIPFLPLLITGYWQWWEAWVYAGVNILGFAVSRILAARRHPDLLVERAKFSRHEDAAPWDKVLARVVGLGGGVLPLVAGLDLRFGWSNGVPLLLELMSLLMILAGYGLGAYALVMNRFFSGMVRIQYERGHEVVSSGPYRWVRHPGYAGALVTYLATPLFLNSMWAFLPAGLLATALVVRTKLEDEVLRDQLEGYESYAREVQFRLFPGVW